MSSTQERNLDYLAAKHAQELVGRTEKAKGLENSLTKTLGVLQENGVYACFLYLYAREKEIANSVAAAMLTLLRDLGLDAPQKDAQKEVLAWLAEMSRRLNDLLLAREALELMLIYARYGAKARQKEK